MKKRFLIGGGILVLVVGYLLFLSLGSSVSYYLTVSEFVDKGDQFYDTHVRVAGKVVGDSIDWSAEDLELRFAITEGGKTLSVIYNGAKPSGFKAGSDILVDGKYDSGKIFRASQLILKCPSKYEPED
ncbi:MAG TPA: cytochrome c maturation protein CcmE [Dehalococcoidia bacterium]|nr:cytochrome c maturation protein CcmE [Dehalococcoidia bacterium]